MDKTLDYVEPIAIRADAVGRFHNELNALVSLQLGLHFLYRQIRRLEQEALKAFDTEATISDASKTEAEFTRRHLVSGFHWYAVSACNFAILIGKIGQELDPACPAPKRYVKRVMPAVYLYRHKVGAHFERAQRSNNPAEQFSSLIPPSALVNGRYTASAYKIIIRRSGKVSDSRSMQPWSLTRTHEELAPRYWPNVGLRTGSRDFGEHLPQPVSR